MLANRRAFLRNAITLAAATPALQTLAACASAEARRSLAPDPLGAIDLPEGFTYRALSQTGEPMSDGLFVPGAHDGMAAFPVEGDPKRCVLVRNHEIRPGDDSRGAFGPGHAKAAAIDPALLYDRTAGGRPLLGGTTTLIVNVAERSVERSFLSLAGTATNCAGGPTPWGSWLSCEETEETPGADARLMHGFVFEVPAAQRGLVKPIPLKAMGRFRHEACAVDPATGIVYLTEDQGDGLFYRFLPAKPGALAEGGKLQALALADETAADTRNWAGKTAFPVGATRDVRWIDLEDVEAPNSDLRQRGHAAGAALFARGEGMSVALENGAPSIYFACTNGGGAKRGQVFRLRPNAAGDKLDLFVESRSDSHFDMVDNIVVAPWGDLIMCEDGDGDNYVRGVTPKGEVYPIARTGLSEFCGACFSPDGSTLFVNVQRPGITYAIQGPWRTLAGG